jgi:hypothetical protein
MITNIGIVSKSGLSKSHRLYITYIIYVHTCLSLSSVWMVKFSWKLPSCGIQANPNRIWPDSTWSEGIDKFGRCFQATSVAFQHSEYPYLCLYGFLWFLLGMKRFPLINHHVSHMFPICFPYVSYMVPICFPYVSHKTQPFSHLGLSWPSSSKGEEGAGDVGKAGASPSGIHPFGHWKSEKPFIIGCTHLFNAYIYNIIIYTYDII